MSQTTTSPATPAELVLAALGRRLQVALEVLDPASVRGQERDQDPGALVAAVVAAVRRELSDDRIWLTLTAVAGCYPTRTEVDATRRAFELGDDVELSFVLLDHALAMAATGNNMTADIRIVADAVLVDVDHTAAHDLHTGIQRVVREVLPVLAADYDLVPVRWTANTGALVGLSRLETRRVLAWSELERRQQRHGDELDQDFDQADRTVLVPWRSVLLLLEVPPTDSADRLAGLGDKSGNRVVGVFYDAIPVASADMVPSEDTTKFVRYLTGIKFAARMAGLSAAATAEIRGFTTALATQGLPGPLVAEVALPTPPLRQASGRPRHRDFSPGSAHPEPSVLAIGSHEPRKNHLAVLQAAEVLWREGLRFRLEFIGGSGWGDEFPDRVAALSEAGRRVRSRRAVPDADLQQALASAAFTVFPSLHEGFGLPVAESLTFGTPVLTSDFGSLAEIAREGGCLMVNPRDDAELVDGMRRMMTEPGLLDRLTGEIAARSRRNWSDYATDLWSFLVEPELAALRGGHA